jgi:hypothetical protein
MRREVLVVSAAGGLAALACAPLLQATAAHAAAANSYAQYHVVLANGESGEPSISWNPKAKSAMYGAGTSISTLSWNDAAAGSPMTGKDITPATGTVTTLDTIVTVDQTTSRTYFAELLAAGADISYSDDGGATWTQSTRIAPGALLDHESVGAGPLAPTSVPHPLSNSSVYYCAQNSFNGACGVSYDGGLTYGPGVPAYNTPANDTADPNTTFAAEGGACSALHGHLKVGPDGTAYLPIKGCGGTPITTNLTNTEYGGGVPSMSVSSDNGQTWQVRMNPDGSNTDESDNSVAIGPKNTVYMTWEDGINISASESAHTTSAKVSISTDKGLTWLNTTNLNPAGINNVMFPVVTVGDDNRAAVSFLGSAGIGDDQQNGFVGAWDLYVSTTYDGGKTWTTVDATAGDPVHRGCIDNQGIAPGSPKNNVCSNRNMLDFNDITTDSTGRVLVAYTKTCTSAACLAAGAPNDGSNSTDVQDYVVRQSGGTGLYVAGDGQIGGVPGTTVPEAPLAYLLVPVGAAAVAIAGRRRVVRRRGGDRSRS